jgi:DNA-binding LytR/AlgR family response regulator
MPTALIAEDEPLLAAALQHELQRAWPELQLLPTAPHGLAAVELALQHGPDVLFLDVRMPGQTGLDAAAELAERWEDEAPPGRAFPSLVFVTAYDQYAVQAFEAQAVDYLLKPVLPERLARTVQRLQQHMLQTSAQAGPVPEALLQQLQALLAPAPAAATPRLQIIQASAGSSLHMLPIGDVLVFEAADKYVRVLTAENANVPELLIRTPLKDLLPQLDPDAFWQIHRGTVVRASAIARVQRDEAGKLWLHLRQRPERWAISRLFAGRFKGM